MGRTIRTRASQDPSSSSPSGSSDPLSKGDIALEAVINISEGRDTPWLQATAASLPALVDLHGDSDHNRSVFTLLGGADDVIASTHELCRRAVEHVVIAHHEGVHPRLGAVDVLPFVPLGSTPLLVAQTLRDDTSSWLATELDVPCFLYGPGTPGDRTLPEVRRGAFSDLSPDIGPSKAHPTAGATAVGARPVLVAWNLWLEGSSIEEARRIAASVRSARVRALGLEVTGGVQVSCNLLDAAIETPADVADQVRSQIDSGAKIARSELVGLAPAACLAAVGQSRWAELDLSEDRTIEAKAEMRGVKLA